MREAAITLTDAAIDRSGFGLRGGGGGQGHDEAIMRAYGGLSVMVLHHTGSLAEISADLAQS